MHWEQRVDGPEKILDFGVVIYSHRFKGASHADAMGIPF